MPQQVIRIALIAFLFGLTACPTPPKPVQRVTPVPAAPAIIEAPSVALAPAPVPPPLAPPTNSIPEPALTIQPAPAVPAQPRYPLDQWIASKTWSEMAGVALSPRQARPAAGSAYELRSTNAVMLVSIGSRVALWNGISIGLGFEPKLSDGEALFHGLDAAKNFEPLLREFSLSRGNNVIVIDPGHGGENKGTKSVAAEQYEKDYTLDWALRLRPLLEARGWTVVLTRTNDCDLSLADRVALADQAQAQLFVSLHFNSLDPRHALRAEIGGLETYCLTPKGMASNLVREFGDDPQREFPNNQFDIENLQYAAQLHRSLIETTQLRDRGVRRARFMGVLQGQNRPAVLIEGGYLSHPQEARLIGSPEYRQKLAEGVAQALQ